MRRALTAGTPVEIVNVPADDRQLSLQKDYIERRTGALAPTFASATAVIALTNALPGDPLYRFARAANISIVDIRRNRAMVACLRLKMLFGITVLSYSKK